MRGFNEKAIENLTNLVGSLADIQNEAKETLDNLITSEVEAEMTEAQKLMMNDLKSAINLEGCSNLSTKLDEINRALKKHNL